MTQLRGRGEWRLSWRRLSHNPINSKQREEIETDPIPPAVHRPGQMPHDERARKAGE
jgi:hypothetical protein